MTTPGSAQPGAWHGAEVGSDARREGLDRLLAACFGFVGWVVLGVLALQGLAGATGIDPAVRSTAGTGVVIAATGLQAVGVTLLALLPKVPPAGPLRPRSWWFGPASYAVVLPAWILVSFVVYVPLVQSLGVDVPPQPHLAWFQDPETVPLWVGVLTISVFGPVVEEILFRGWLQTGLGAVFGLVPALLVSSVLFGLLHGPVYAFPIGLLGAYYGWLRIRTGGLAAPVAAHCVHNFLMVLLTMQLPGLQDQAFGR